MLFTSSFGPLITNNVFNYLDIEWVWNVVLIIISILFMHDEALSKSGLDRLYCRRDINHHTHKTHSEKLKIQN